VAQVRYPPKVPPELRGQQPQSVLTIEEDVSAKRSFHALLDAFEVFAHHRFGRFIAEWSEGCHGEKLTELAKLVNTSGVYRCAECSWKFQTTVRS
jgi:hypothetical protein